MKGGAERAEGSTPPSVFQRALSLKAFVVPGLPHAGHHVLQEPVGAETVPPLTEHVRSKQLKADQKTPLNENVFFFRKNFKSICKKSVDGWYFIVLDAICQNDESNENAHGAIQVPDVSMVLEDFGADQNGKSHDGTDQRVEP